MSDLDELLSAFDGGLLRRPSHLVPNVVDLARALASLADAPGITPSHNSEMVERLIGQADHLVFVLADGMGTEQVEALPENAFLRLHLRAELQTVFPSSTAPAVTSFATGEWPARHGVTGWWTHLPQIGAAAAVLPFVARSGARPLAALGVAPDDVYLLPPLIRGVERDTLSVFPRSIADSVYSVYLSGGRPRQGYASLHEAVDLVTSRIAGAASPTYTYLYTPLIDAAAHRYGALHEWTLETVLGINAEMERLAEGIRGRGKLVVSADHGLLDAPPGARRRLVASHWVTGGLRFAPSGDARVLYLHVGEGSGADDLDVFHRHLGSRFLLISIQEAEDLELFGPGLISPAVRERMGDVVAISTGHDVVAYEPDARMWSIMNEKAQHSGLSHSEMRVPLVIA